MIFKGPEAFGFGAFCLSCNSGKNRAVPDFCKIVAVRQTKMPPHTATDTAFPYGFLSMNVMASFKSTFCLADFRFLLAKKLDFRKIQFFT